MILVLNNISAFANVIRTLLLLKDISFLNVEVQCSFLFPKFSQNFDSSDAKFLEDWQIKKFNIFSSFSKEKHPARGSATAGKIRK